MNRFSYLTDRYEPTDEVKVRDRGLLESASARPMAALADADAYPSLEDKAAALPHSLAATTPWWTRTSGWR